jgi:4-amino-4-deoxychorismate lyase
MSAGDALVRDGALVDPDSVNICFLDPAFLYGEGCFETLRTYDGVAFAVAEHHAQLLAGATDFAPERPRPPLDTVQTAIDRVLIERRRRFGRPVESVVRLVLAPTESGAGLSFFCHATDLPDPRLVTALRGRGARLLSRGALLGPGAVGLGVSTKSLSYALRRAALRWAVERGADEVACFSDDGYLQSGATCNLALLVGDRLVSPAPEPTHVRAGVTLARLCSVAHSLGFSAERRPVHRDEFASADAALSASSLREVVPVVALDGQWIGAGHAWDVSPWLGALRASECRS